MADNAEKCIDPEEMKALLEQAGGIENIMRSAAQFKKDHIFLDKNTKEWVRLYPEKWVAVFKEELIAVSRDYDEFRQLVDGKNIPKPYSAAEMFLSAKKVSWILSLSLSSC